MIVTCTINIVGHMMSDYPVLVSTRYHHQYQLKSCKMLERLQTVCNERKFIK